MLANDPDADRLAVAVGGRRLTGDEVGCLLGHHLLSTRPADRERLVVTTIVSSPLLARIADDFGAHRERTLTGFKWIVRPALAHPEWEFVLGYEEALGYAVGSLVRDKDGITAALVVAELAAALEAEATRCRTASTSSTAVRPVPDSSAVVPHRARRPSRRDGAARVLPAHRRPAAPGRRRDRQVGAGRVVFRPSGTEPKLKLYAEVVDGDLDALLDEAAAWAGLRPVGVRASIQRRRGRRPEPAEVPVELRFGIA